MHIELVLCPLHWLLVEYWVGFKFLVLTFKALRSQWPTYLQDLLSPYVPKRVLHSQDLYLLVIPWAMGHLLSLSWGQGLFSPGPSLVEHASS